MRDIELRDSIKVDGEEYFHYEYGGKYFATKFIVVNGIHFYNAKMQKLDFE
tara:strand:- start:307 stop:459 length:153 start_codon:yes stop_codon:yes gene_type:complete